jgi:hypothetical protein
LEDDDESIDPGPSALMPRYLTETLWSVEGNHNLDDEQIEADDLQTSLSFKWYTWRTSPQACC